MSTTIDERVVEMRFDNKQFESNVATSMSTLDKLKQKLNLSGASKGLEDVNAAAKKVDMSGLGSGVESVSAKFSAMQVIGITALSNITNSAVNAGKRIVSALTIDPIRTGFQEYETQINAVQTILANTSSKGTTIDQVNTALDELNRYADLTIYNFTEMTRNIGTFTAAGIDLDTSVSAIQGIANLAAVSGSTSQQASTAMYQLSQALATGTVKLMDWNSVVNAGMGGEVFQNALKETSRLLGTGADAAIEASGSFRESLSDGWLTAEVLTETLKKFTTSGAAEYLAEFTGLSQETVDATLEATDAWGDEADAIDKAAEALANKSGKNKDEIKAALQMAKNAEDAATKVKTFTQLWEVLKESAQSGWSSTWKIIIGDFEDAKALLTPLADTLTGFINKMSDWRNNILQGALDFSKPWQSISEKLNGAGFGKVKEIAKSFENISDKVKTASDKLEYFQDIVNKVWRGDYNNWGDNPDRRDLLAAAGYDSKVVQELVNKGYQYELTIEDVEAAHAKFGLTMESTTEETKKTTKEVNNATVAFEDLSDEQLKQAGLTEDEIDLYRALEKEADRLGMSVSDLAEEMSTNDGRTLLIDSFKNAASGLIGIGKAIKEAWADVFNPPGVGELAVKLYGAIKSLNEFSEKLRLTDKDTGELNETGKKLKRTFAGVFAIVDMVATVLGGGLKIAFKAVSQILSYFHLDILDVTAAIGDAIVKFHDWFESIFDISGVLDAIVPLISKAADAIRNWFDAFKDSKGMQNVVKYIREIGTGIKEWWAGLKDAEDLPKAIAEGIVKFFSSIPTVISTVFSNIWSALKSSFRGFDGNPLSGFIDKIKSGLGIVGQTLAELGKIILEKINGVLTAHGFEAISTDAIAGLANGLRNGAVNAWNAAVELASKLVEKVKDFLGIHSPSTVFAAIGGFIIAGLVMGLQNGIPDSLGAIKDVFQPMLDWIKGLDFGTIFAAIMGIGSIGAVNNLTGVLDKFASPLEGLGEVFSGVGAVLKKSAKPIAKVIKQTAKVVKSFSKVLNAVAFDIKADGIKKLGETLLMLVGAIVILTFFEPAELWNAVGLVAALAAILVVLSLAMSKINSSAATINKNGINVKGLSSGLIGIGAAILLMAVAVKMLGSLDPDQAKQGFLSLAGLVVALGVVVAAFGLFVKGKSAENVEGFGKAMVKISAALLIMAYVVKTLGKMDQSELIQGGLAIAYFSAIIVGLMAATKLISGSKNVDKIGGALLKIALAIGVMALVVKALGGMDKAELIQGGLAITYFAGIMVGLMAATKLINGSKNVGEIGGALLKIAVAIGIMGLVAKLLGGMDTAELVKGGLAITAFAGIIVGLMAATKLISGSKNVSKIGISLLAISGAIAVMAITAVMLSMVSVEDLAKGTGMIAIFAGIIVGLMAATKLVSGSTNVDKIGKTLLAVSGAIAILAGIAVLIGMVPTKNLIKGTAVVVALAAVMAGLIAVTKLAKKSVGNIVALTVMIAVLAGAVYLISRIDSKSAITSAVVLGGLMLAMTGVLAILSLVGKASKSALKGVLVLTALAVPMLAFVGVLSLMSGVKHAKSNVEALGILVGVLTIALIPLTVIGSFIGAALTGVLALTAMAVPMLAFVGVLAIMNNVKNAMHNATLLGTFMSLMAGILVEISLVAPLAVIGVAAMAGLTLLMGAIGTMAVAVGALMEKFPAIQKFLDTGIPVLEQLSKSIGTMIGNFVGGLITGIGDAIIELLPKLGTALSEFMVGAQPFITLAKSVDSSVIAGAGILTGSILALTAADFLAGIAQILNGGLSFSDLGVELAAFGAGVLAFFTTIKGVDESGIEAATNIADMILVLTASEVISAIVEKFGGSVDFSTVGQNLKSFGEAVVGFSETISGNIDPEAVNAAANAGQMMAQLNESLPRSGGWVQDVIGEKDFAAFSESVKAFATCIIEINDTLSEEGFEIQSDKITQLTDAGTQFCELNNALPRTDGWVQDIIGEKDLGVFGESVKAFANCLIDINEAISQEGFNFQSDKFTQLVDAGTQFSELNASLPKTDGWVQDIVGKKDLGVFGESVAAFADCLIEVNEAISQEGFAVNLDGMEDLKEAGLKLNDLQTVLPKSGGWWQNIAGEKDIGDFGSKIKNFSEAIVEFSTSSADIDNASISSCLGIVYRIKSLMESLVDLDTSGVETFTGIGTGGFGADGPAYDIARAIVKFSETVEGIDTEAVTVATTAATRLKSLISSLVDLDTSGIENFKPVEIGEQMGSYADKVGGMDTKTVASSISSANKLKNFISSLVGLDTSGISNFKIASIGSSLKNYASSVSKFNASTVSTSISAAKNLKNLISSLAQLDTSGVSSFKNAVNQLSSINIAGVVKAFSGASSKFSSAGVDMINGLIKGMQSKTSSLKSAANKMTTSITQTLKSKIPTFGTAGQTLATRLATGISSKKGYINSIVASCVSGASTKIRNYYSLFYNAGKYLVQGFANGISANTYIATAKARAMASAAAQAARNQLNINSPSKVFRAIGKSIPEGFAMGIGMMGSSIKSAVVDMTDTALYGTKYAIASIADYLGSDLDAQPVISPIVDLSNVNSGVNTINDLLNMKTSIGSRSNLSAISFAMNNRQNETYDVLSAIDKLGSKLDNLSGNTYNIDGITYDDGSNISDTVKTLVRAIRVERRR